MLNNVLMFPHVLSIFFKSSKIASYYFRYHLNKNGAKILRIRFKNFSFLGHLKPDSPRLSQYRSIFYRNCCFWKFDSVFLLCFHIRKLSRKCIKIFSFWLSGDFIFPGVSVNKMKGFSQGFVHNVRKSYFSWSFGIVMRS